MKIARVGVIGGGAWGTALAQAQRLAGHEVVLWARESETVDDINVRHVNRTFLPGIPLDPALKATTAIEDATRCDAILLVPPAQHIRQLARAIRPFVKPGTPVVLCSKGIERESGRLLGDVLREELGDPILAVLSGPSFASDVARGLPVALTIATTNEALGRALANDLGSGTFRLYWSSDIIGVEIGGALKNVLAIAAGIVDGKGLGASAHAALVTRGFAEMRRLATAMGGRPETMLGLSGIGDLILTCGSAQSRNMSLGRELALGQSLVDVLGQRVAVTEGVYTAAAAVALARSKNIELPITEAVHDIIEGRLTVDQAIAALMQRPIKAED